MLIKSQYIATEPRGAIRYRWVRVVFVALSLFFSGACLIMLVRGELASALVAAVAVGCMF